MKEMLKSKVMILFMVIMLGVTYIGASKTEHLEDENLREYQEMVMASVK